MNARNIVDPEHRDAEVSTQALAVFWTWLADNGVVVETVFTELAALGWEREALTRRGGWVPYRALLDLERCVALRFPDHPGIFHAIGMSVGPSEGLGFLRTVSRTLFSPHLLYHRMPGMTRRFLFRFMTLDLQSTSREHIVAQYVFEPHCPPSDAFLETARGVLTGMPLMLGAPAAKVRLERTGPLTARADIVIAPWGGPVQATASAMSRFWLGMQLRLRAPSEAGDAVLEANRLLQDQVAEVNTARAELADKVRDLETLREQLADLVTERTSDLEHARTQLEETVRHLELASNARTKFFTNVSHEFKTPLTLILAAVDELGDAERTGAATIGRHAQSLLRLINELLDLARLDAGRMPLRRSDFDLVAAVTEVTDSLRPMLDARRMRLELLTPPDAVVVTADRTLILRAVVNLVVNAIKYCPEGARLRIEVRSNPTDVQLDVADDGPGIPADQQRHIFARFGQGIAAESRWGTGSGIGLAMVAEIMKLHDGEVRVTSAPDQGSCFTLTLPVHLASQASGTAATDVVSATPAQLIDDAWLAFGTAPSRLHEGIPETPEETTREATQADEADHPGRATVLVVDDNPELRAHLGRIVSRRHGVLFAENGAQALAIARQRLPDLVLTDVMMPVLDGHALCRALKEDPATATIPVILITARHGPEALVEGFDALADDFVRKPFSADELLARIATHLRVKRLTLHLIRTEKSQLLSTLSSGMAHEILNPVNAQLQAVRLLRDATLQLESGERDALLGAVERGGRRIEQIVRSVQSFAHSDNRKQRWRRVRLGAQLDAIRPLVAHRLDTTHSLHIDVGDDPTWRCVPDLLDQALTNLILNGLDAGNTVLVQVLTLSGGGVEVRVSDDGEGVPLGMREEIFTPFFTTKEPGKGTRMGLAITREIADLHGGTLELAPPAENQGACFVLRLPGGTEEETG